MLKDNVSDIKHIFKIAVKEQLLKDGFINYLIDSNTINNIQDRTNATLFTLFEDLFDDDKIIKAYIDYDVGLKNIEAGWAHRCVLQALAHIQGIQLKIWLLDANKKLIPHQHDDYQEYIGPNDDAPKNLLFVNNNHFELIDIQKPQRSAQLSQTTMPSDSKFASQQISKIKPVIKNQNKPKKSKTSLNKKNKLSPTELALRKQLQQQAFAKAKEEMNAAQAAKKSDDVNMEYSTRS